MGVKQMTLIPSPAAMRNTVAGLVLLLMVVPGSVLVFQWLLYRFIVPDHPGVIG